MFLQFNMVVLFSIIAKLEVSGHRLQIAKRTMTCLGLSPKKSNIIETLKL